MREWYHPCDTTFAGRGEGGITRMIPLAPVGIPIGIPARCFVPGWIPIGIHPGIDGQLREKNQLKGFFSSPVSFASIAFGYPNANFGGCPQTPLRCRSPAASA